MIVEEKNQEAAPIGAAFWFPLPSVSPSPISGILFVKKKLYAILPVRLNKEEA